MPSGPPALASRFYALQLAAHLTWTLLAWLLRRKPLHALTAAAVVERPPWLPAALLLRLHSHRRSIFVALPIACAAAVALPSHPTLLAAALAVTLYHLTESSATSRHGERHASIPPAPSFFRFNTSQCHLETCHKSSALRGISILHQSRSSNVLTP